MLFRKTDNTRKLSFGRRADLAVIAWKKSQRTKTYFASTTGTKPEKNSTVPHQNWSGPVRGTETKLVRCKDKSCKFVWYGTVRTRYSTVRTRIAVTNSDALLYIVKSNIFLNVDIKIVF